MITLRADIERTASWRSISFPLRSKVETAIPESWAEMRTRHYPAALRLLACAARSGDEDSMLSASASLLCEWAGIPGYLSAAPSVAENQDHARISLNLLKTLKQPALLLKRAGLLRGPGKRLRNMKFRQYVTAERVFREWADTLDPELERAVVALTWHLPFIPWRPWMSTAYMWMLKIVPRALRARMLCTYMSQRAFLRDMYPELYNASGSGGRTPRIDQVILSLSGPELGSYHSVAYQPVHRALELMQMREIQFRKNNPKNANSNLTVEELHEAARRKVNGHQGD